MRCCTCHFFGYYLVVVSVVVKELLGDVCEPCERSVKRVWASQVEDDDCAVGILIEDAGEAAKALVAGDVPQLNVHHLTIDLHLSM